MKKPIAIVGGLVLAVLIALVAVFFVSDNGEKVDLTGEYELVELTESQFEIALPLDDVNALKSQSGNAIGTLNCKEDGSVIFTLFGIPFDGEWSSNSLGSKLVINGVEFNFAFNEDGHLSLTKKNTEGGAEVTDDEWLFKEYGTATYEGEPEPDISNYTGNVIYGEIAEDETCKIMSLRHFDMEDMLGYALVAFNKTDDVIKLVGNVEATTVDGDVLESSFERAASPNIFASTSFLLALDGQKLTIDDIEKVEGTISVFDEAGENLLGTYDLAL